MLSPEVKHILMEKAVQAAKKAYCPYSKYYVGAAILVRASRDTYVPADLHVVTGCNVENASYGLTNCAERTAVFKAVSEGYTDFAAIAIVTRDGGLPCGACRQVLNEFGPELPLLMGNLDGTIVTETTLNEILPMAFGPKNLL